MQTILYTNPNRWSNDVRAGKKDGRGISDNYNVGYKGW